MMPLAGLSSLTGGGGLSAGSSATAGDQTSGGFAVGDFNGAATAGLGVQPVYMIGGAVLMLVLGMVIAKKKPKK